MEFTIKTLLKMIPLIILIGLSVAVFFEMIELDMDLFCLKLILVILIIIIIYNPGKGGVTSADYRTDSDPQSSPRNL